MVFTDKESKAWRTGFACLDNCAERPLYLAKHLVLELHHAKVWKTCRSGLKYVFGLVKNLKQNLTSVLSRPHFEEIVAGHLACRWTFEKEVKELRTGFGKAPWNILYCRASLNKYRFHCYFAKFYTCVKFFLQRYF